jgi:FixJ family two-component response regulator
MIGSHSGAVALPETRSSGLIVVLNKDLFFGVKIGNMLRALGYTVEFARTAETFVSAINSSESGVALGIIDINAGVDWSLIERLTSSETRKPPLLAFGSHLDVEGLRAAKLAGVRRVVSNGDFHRDMVKLVQRYASQSGSATVPETPEGVT